MTKRKKVLPAWKSLKLLVKKKKTLRNSEKVAQSIQKNQRTNFLEALFDPVITLIIGLAYVLTILVGGRFIMNGSSP